MFSITDPTHQRLEELLLVDRSFDEHSNIIGFGLGKKVRDGFRTGEDAVTVFVRKKLPRTALQRNPKSRPIRRAIHLHEHMNVEDVFDFDKFIGDEQPLQPGETWSDIVESSSPLRLQANSGHFGGDVIGGISIGLELETTGTVGYFVRNKLATRPAREFYVLTAGHVLNKLCNPPPTTRVCQPGSDDCRLLGLSPKQCYLADVVDTTQLQFNVGSPGRTLVDAGIARPIHSAQAGPASTGTCNPDILRMRILECGGVTGIGTAEVGMLVKKAGRTTGLTWGRITHTQSSYDFVHPADANRRTILSNQILTTAMSREGDSGALLLDEANRAIGLLCAGCEDQSVFTPIDAVLSTLGVELY